MTLTTKQITHLVNGQLTGPNDIIINSLQSLDLAGQGQLTFIGDQSHANRWQDSNASAALIQSNITIQNSTNRALITVDNVDLAMTQILQHFMPDPVLPQQGIHHSSIIDPSADIPDSARIGPHCVIGPNVTIGDNSVIHANVTIHDNSSIDNNTTIWSGTVIRERSYIGNNSIIHANVSIGSDGFGYRPSPDGKSIVKTPHLAGVRIGNHVEIGSGTCIDRGKFVDTQIGDHTKIDNLVQIAHNCVIGKAVIIAGLCGIAGSVTIHDGVTLGGQCGIADQLTIGAGATLAACSQLMNNVPPGETWLGSPATEASIARRQYVAIRKLPTLIKTIRKLMPRD